ncbi:MAG: methyltransferase domain-containing protein [Bryobacteraceae bacterium]|jgi:SAM-dependent methyltransferase
MTGFTCNICGRANPHPEKPLSRETESCLACGSTVRTRGLAQALSLELFGINLAIPDFPRVKSLRGIGTSDSSQYADRLAEKFDYRNTFYHREPRLDITNPPQEELGRYDFLISSEVLEHVAPPPETAFRSAFQLLKPNGVFVLTAPYSLERSTTEHFPDLHEFGFAQLGGRVVLVNRTRDGQVQVFEDLVFHGGGGGQMVEMREFNEDGVCRMLTGAGFADVRFYCEDYPPFGIVRAESWGLPVAARKSPFAFTLGATRDVLEQWRDLNLKFHGEMQRLDRALWFRIGRKLKLL